MKFIDKIRNFVHNGEEELGPDFWLLLACIILVLKVGVEIISFVVAVIQPLLYLVVFCFVTYYVIKVASELRDHELL